MPVAALRLATALVAVALLLLPAVARAGQPPAGQPAAGELDVPGFLATLDALAGRAEAARSPADLAAVARDLPAAWTVRAGPDRFIVDGAPIADALTAADDEAWLDARARAVGRIDALRAEAAPLAAAGPPPPAHLRGALTEILAAPEFRGRQRYASLLAFAER